MCVCVCAVRSENPVYLYNVENVSVHISYARTGVTCILFNHIMFVEFLFGGKIIVSFFLAHSLESFASFTHLLPIHCFANRKVSKSNKCTFECLCALVCKLKKKNGFDIFTFDLYG